MKYVIDLNVIWYAWTGVGEHGKPECDCANLLLMIARTCERVIVTDEINKAYLELFKGLKDMYPQGPKLLLFSTLYFRWKQTKKVDDTRLDRDVPLLGKESEIHEEDRKYVRLARLTNAVLVTNDRGVIHLGSELGYTAMTPSEVLITDEQKSKSG